MVYLIYGPPCSGKSTYISSQLGKNDIVCDVDLIFEAISNHEGHDNDLYVHEIALKLRETLLDIIRDRNGGWDNAYVVSIANTDSKVKKDAGRINADKCLLMNTPFEVCMERAKDRPFHFKYLIQEWFELRDLKDSEVIADG